MPEKIFEYLITAAGLMLIYNWLFILVTYWKIMELTKWGHVKNGIGMLLIAVTVSGTLGEKQADSVLREPALYSLNQCGDLDCCEKAKKHYGMNRFPETSLKRTFRWTMVIIT